MNSTVLPHFLFVGDLKISAFFVSDHDLKYEVYLMCRVLV